MYRAESLVHVSFLRKHDVIKIGPKPKGNVLRVHVSYRSHYRYCIHTGGGLKPEFLTGHTTGIVYIQEVVLNQSFLQVTLQVLYTYRRWS